VFPQQEAFTKPVGAKEMWRSSKDHHS